MQAMSSQIFLDQTLILESFLELEALSSECPQQWKILAIRGLLSLKTAKNIWVSDPVKKYMIKLGNAKVVNHTE